MLSASHDLYFSHDTVKRPLRHSQALGVTSPTTVEGPVLFFDGTCVLCNGLADFVLRCDRNGTLRLATLQGLTAAWVLGDGEPRSLARPSAFHDFGDLGSVVLWDRGQIYRKSEAVIRAAQILGGVFRCAFLFRLIPRAVRDLVYDLVARNRFRWFGQRASCRLPTTAESTRFLP